MIVGMNKRRGLTKKQRRRKKKIQLMNKRLIKKYYWLVPRNVWSGRIPRDYDYTWINWIEWDSGWGKAFGWLYLKELGAAIKESKQKDFQIFDLKEKYGEQRLYPNHASKKVYDIIEKYEHISRHICYHCGTEAPLTDNGWVLPRCFKCFCKEYRRSEDWVIENHPEKSRKNDIELFEMYKKCVCVKPDENGEYHIPNSYTVQCCNKGEWSDKVYDISDTVNKIRKRIEKFNKE